MPRPAFRPFGRRGCGVLRAVPARHERRASALSVFGHVRRRRHPAQRRDAAQFRRLQQWRKRRSRHPAGAVDAVGRRCAHLDQFRGPDQQRGSCAARRFFNNPQYAITDPSTLVPVNHAIKKVGIVYSATTAALYFGGGAAGADRLCRFVHGGAASGGSCRRLL